MQVLAETQAELPPILVHWPSMRVIDGMHRLVAARLKQERTIKVRFFEGDECEAFIAAVKANVTHGLPLTVADREAAAVQIIEIHPHASDRSIAAMAGLGPRRVAALRQRMGTEEARSLVRLGRDGRLRPLNSADGRRVASEIMAKRPDASLREVAKLAGISPATVQDVRRRMERGEDPVPAKLRTEHEEPRPHNGTGHEDSPSARKSHVDPLARDCDRGPTRDRASMLESLRKDPSLRLSVNGRKVLHWLYTHTAGPRGWEDIVHEIPTHSAYVVAQMARDCAFEWSVFAQQLERRLQTSEER
ncbi:streptomycin biosynthesis protein [Nonomuraea angiospora]|uniref:Streptomycin biosynthesis protein n=1 Tax=Nonomuraea angiospora TaxID=46172 RepID=A0ABR9LNP2_9ACTN|nr:streptomycin biosynthesis protein [Nonomuraea angiospora]MBE1582275.1 hypothetical protein [Nonomuraea angiospora]